MASTMASPTAASAAASTITKMLKTCPVSFPGPSTKWLKAMKFTLAAFRISSTPIRMPTALRRVTTVMRPSANRIAPTMRKCGSPMVSMSLPRALAGLVGRLLDLLAGDDDRADQRREEHDGCDFERQQVLG